MSAQLNEVHKTTLPKHTGIRKLANGRFRARYFAGYNSEGKRVYPARTFDSETAARKWRSESVASRISSKDVARSLAFQYSQGAVYSAPFAIPHNLKTIRRELVELHLPLARICCVYFLVSLFDEVLYVGQTTDLHQRIKAHQRAEVRFTRVLFVPVQEPDLVSTEAYFIRTLNPPLNRTQGSNCGSELAQRVSELVCSQPSNLRRRTEYETQDSETERKGRRLIDPKPSARNLERKRSSTFKQMKG